MEPVPLRDSSSLPVHSRDVHDAGRRRLVGTESRRPIVSRNMGRRPFSCLNRWAVPGVDTLCMHHDGCVDAGLPCSHAKVKTLLEVRAGLAETSQQQQPMAPSACSRLYCSGLPRSLRRKAAPLLPPSTCFGQPNRHHCLVCASFLGNPLIQLREEVGLARSCFSLSSSRHPAPNRIQTCSQTRPAGSQSTRPARPVKLGMGMAFVGFAI